MATNEVVKINSGEVDPYEQLGDGIGARAHIHGNLLRFTKHGDYVDGQEKDELNLGTRMLAYMPSLKKGWVKWEEGQPVRHILGLVEDGYKPPLREELGDMDESEWGELNGRPIDPWQFTFYLTMLDEEGQLHTFVTSSDGGKQTIDNLGKKYGPRRRMKPGEQPILALDATSYKHPKYGQTFKPVLRVDGWAKTPKDFDELKAALGNEDGQEVIEDKTEEFRIKTAKAKPKVVEAKAKSKNGQRKGVRF